MCHKETARSPRIWDLAWICLPDTVETETGDGGNDALNTPLVQPIDDVALHVGPVPVDADQLHSVAVAVHGDHPITLLSRSEGELDGDTVTIVDEEREQQDCHGQPSDGKHC